MILDKDRIDAHKLIFHPHEVVEWLEGKLVYPINLEVCISGACNHRCIFCACDYMNYKPYMLSKDVWLSTLQNIRRGGGVNLLCSLVRASLCFTPTSAA